MTKDYKGNTTSIRLKPRLRTALERMARDDVRTLSSMIEKILTQAARESGHFHEDGEVEEKAPKP
jgi:hypothetical protein